MSDLALDFSWSTPSALEMRGAEVAVALAYTGSGKPRPSRDYIDSMLLLGIAFAFIQESSATRGFEGYSAGFVDANYAEARAAEVGYPDGCVIYYALADTPNVAGHEAQIAEYARGARDGSSRYRVGGYGPKAAIDAARPYLAKAWGVGTWGYGEGPVGQLPDGLDVDLVQHGNRDAPIPGTDANTILTPDLGAWGQATATKESDVLYRATSNATLVPDIAAGTIWANASTRFLRVGEVPAGAVILDVPGDDIASVSYEMARQRDAAEATLGAAPEAVPCPPGVADASDEDLVAELTARLKG